MSKISLTAVVFAALFVIASSQSAEAQRPAHYYPARQTFSNYLLYAQLNGTGIPNYYSYVRPANQFTEFLARSQNDLTRGPATLTVEQQVGRALDAQLRQRVTTGIGQASVPAQFGNTSHFYQQTTVQRR